jgi:hypothetical protein
LRGLRNTRLGRLVRRNRLRATAREGQEQQRRTTQDPTPKNDVHEPSDARRTQKF